MSTYVFILQRAGEAVSEAGSTVKASLKNATVAIHVAAKVSCVTSVVLRVKRYHCWVSNETFIFYSNYHLPSGFRQQEVDGEQAQRHRISADDDSRPGGEVCRQHRALPCHRQRRSRHEVTL